MKIVRQFLEDLKLMQPFERWRIIFQIVTILATLGAPFVAVWLNKNWN
jgi:hypothetical protein